MFLFINFMISWLKQSIVWIKANSDFGLHFLTYAFVVFCHSIFDCEQKSRPIHNVASLSSSRTVVKIVKISSYLFICRCTKSHKFGNSPRNPHKVSKSHIRLHIVAKNFKKSQKVEQSCTQLQKVTLTVT